MWSPIRVKPLKSLSSRLAGKSMIIESIELKNYRNYKELHMEFNQGTQYTLWGQCPGKDQYPGGGLRVLHVQIT